MRTQKQKPVSLAPLAFDYCDALAGFPSEEYEARACEHDLLAAFPRNADGTVSCDRLALGLAWDAL